MLYHLTESWNLYANTEGSFGSVQYSQMPNRVAGGEVKPEKARTWELGTRYDNGNLRAEIGAFLINFDHQDESNQTNDTVIAHGHTRHEGIETSVNYALDGLSPMLSGFDVYAADNANTSAESADGSTGRIAGYMLFSSRAAYDFGPQMSDLNVGGRSEKHLQPRVFHPFIR
ncbi:TonB-dependent receptor-like protein [Pseudomonas sp. LP_7_YM]|nr:TonB-dependent receptor-like protein [Pseudomonas sp. LP_7_YM]